MCIASQAKETEVSGEARRYMMPASPYRIVKALFFVCVVSQWCACAFILILTSGISITARSACRVHRLGKEGGRGESIMVHNRREGERGDMVHVVAEVWVHGEGRR